jgi:hypothetical protein
VHLTLGLLVFWTVVGWAVVSTCLPAGGLLRNALLAPVVGVAVTALLLFQLHRFGLPVRTGGPITFVIAAAGSGALLWRRRLPFPLRAWWPFALVLLLGLVAVGYPLLVHGFQWVSFCNDDMANYALGAQGVLDRGFLAPVAAADLVQNRQPSVHLWIVNQFAGIRCGSELLLAWVMGGTGLSGHQAFMPTIVALHGALLSAAGALVCARRRLRWPALLTCAWLAVTPLVALGTVQQLIAQDLGLGLLAATATVVLVPLGDWRRGRVLLAGLLAAVLSFSYPEVLPFFILAVLAYHVLLLVRRAERPANLARFLAAGTAVAVLLLHTFAGSVVAFFRVQATSGMKTATLARILFPFYLVPSGLASFWGFAPLTGQPNELLVLLGGALLLAAVAATVWRFLRADPAAAVALPMLALAVRLYTARSDFGLYKLAMFIQPFLLGTVVLAGFAWIERGGRRRAKRIVLVTAWAGVALLAVRTQQGYVWTSGGWASANPAGFVEIPAASPSHIVGKLRALALEPRHDVVVSDTFNIVLAKFESAYFRGSNLRFPAKDYFATSGNYVWSDLANWFPELVRPGYRQGARALQADRRAWFPLEAFVMSPGVVNAFAQERAPGEDGLPGVYTLLASGPALTVLNRRSSPRAPALRLVASDEVRNHLVLIDSELGGNYYLAGEKRAEGRVAMFQLEPDYFRAGETMASVGRWLLVEVLGPAPRVRLVMEYTASLKADGANTIPPIAVIGGARVALGAVGRGSARLVSPPLTPQWIHGRAYVAIDMGANGQQFSHEVSGVLAWYGAHIPRDARSITGFVRDISLANEALDWPAPPRALTDVAADLRKASLAYSGYYEDAWLGEASFVELSHDGAGNDVRVQVMVPDLPGHPNTLAVLLDGALLAQAAVHPGDNEIRAAAGAVSAGVHRLALRFDGGARLPGRDGRVVAGRADFVGFIPVLR